MEKRVAHLRECACGVGLHGGVGWTRLFGTHPVGVVVVVVRARPLSVVCVFREEHVKVALVQGEGLDGELRAARRLGILVLDKGDATVVPVDANPSAQEPGEGRSLVTAALRDIEESGGFLRTYPAQRRGKLLEVGEVGLLGKVDHERVRDAGASVVIEATGGPAPCRGKAPSRCAVSTLGCALHVKQFHTGSGSGSGGHVELSCRGL